MTNHVPASAPSEDPFDLAAPLRPLSWPVPYLVPDLPPQPIVGREAELAEIARLLALDEDQADNVPPLVLLGMAGVGKTALALVLGYREGLGEHFPDGVLWTALGPDPVIRVVLNEWGRALGVDLLPERDEEACRDRLQAVLEHRRVCMIVDDVWDAAQGAFFQVGSPCCRLLLTTRERPVAEALASADRIYSVNLLRPEAARHLLGHLAPQTVAAAPTPAGRLCAKLEYLPLALNLAGRLLAEVDGDPGARERLLHTLLEKRAARLGLLDFSTRPGLADAAHPASLGAILGLSVSRLTPLEQDRFAMLAVFGGDPLTWEVNAVASVWECTAEEAAQTLRHFLDRGLIAPLNGRYWMHSLLVDYANALLEERGL